MPFRITVMASATGTDSQKDDVRPKRKNTDNEKRRMRNLRKKRMRKMGSGGIKRKMKELKNELDHAKEKVKKGEQHVLLLKNMSRTYWERWRWELEKRKEAMMVNTRIGLHLQSRNTFHPVVNEIDQSMLTDCDQQKEFYIGRGSFGIVRLQMYRAIHVAVKELLPLSVKDDVLHEARILAHLCHPYLPLLFGVCTKTKPLRIVMQFHGFLCGSHPHTVTLSREIKEHLAG